MRAHGRRITCHTQTHRKKERETNTSMTISTMASVVDKRRSMLQIIGTALTHSFTSSMARLLTGKISLSPVLVVVVVCPRYTTHNYYFCLAVCMHACITCVCLSLSFSVCFSPLSSVMSSMCMGVCMVHSLYIMCVCLPLFSICCFRCCCAVVSVVIMCMLFDKVTFFPREFSLRRKVILIALIKRSGCNRV